MRELLGENLFASIYIAGGLLVYSVVSSLRLYRHGDSRSSFDILLESAVPAVSWPLLLAVKTLSLPGRLALVARRSKERKKKEHQQILATSTEDLAKDVERRRNKE